jgi:hypothetical protein
MSNPFLSAIRPPMFSTDAPGDPARLQLLLDAVTSVGAVFAKERWPEGLERLRVIGIEASMHTEANAFPPWLEGTAARIRRLEWYLGQLAALAQSVLRIECKPSVFARALRMLSRIDALEAGVEVSELIARQDAMNRRVAHRAMSEARSAGMLDSESLDFKALFGPWSIEVLRRLVGRRVVMIVRDANDDHLEVEGRLVDVEEGGSGGALIGVMNGSTIRFDADRVTRFAVEDCSSVSLRSFRRRAAERDDLGWEERLLLGLDDVTAVEGRRGSFLLPDRERGRWELIEGLILEGALVEREDGSTVRVNLDHVFEWFVQDTSPIRPRMLERRIQEEGWLRYGSPELHQRLGSCSIDVLEGLKGVALAGNRRAKQWELIEGTIGSVSGASRFAVETADGRRELDAAFIGGLWIPRSELRRGSQREAHR